MTNRSKCRDETEVGTDLFLCNVTHVQVKQIIEGKKSRLGTWCVEVQGLSGPNDWTSPAFVTREKSVVILIEKYKVKTNFKN